VANYYYNNNNNYYYYYYVVDNACKVIHRVNNHKCGVVTNQVSSVVKFGLYQSFKSYKAG